MSRLIVENIKSKHVEPNRTAAMYYKTEPFYTDVNKYTHTNNWEIAKAIEILADKGFSVDLIDRDNSNWMPSKKYDLFLGLGVGNSGKNFVRYSKLSQAKVKILLSLGPQPDISNDLVIKRYQDFNRRTGKKAPPMRTVSEVTGSKFIEIIEAADFIFNIGEIGNQSYNSYLKYNKPILNFYPAVSPAVSFKQEWLSSRDLNSYLCFAGNGLICKGVDVVTEAFLKDNSKKLHICGPSESSFFEQYGDKIAKSSNIKYHGFIEPGGHKFNELAKTCAFVILHSSSEGCCTSVATAIKAGLVPVINSWTGIHVDDCGVVMPEDGDITHTVAQTINYASNFSIEEYGRLVQNTLKKSVIFSQDSYVESYQKALDEVLKRIT